MRKKASGFSLLELAIIVLILGLLTTLTWKFIGAQIQKQTEVTTYSLLERADWALTGFAMSHHRLPCPDTNQDGMEDCAIENQVGTLPYKTLGFADARAGRVRYGALRRTAEVVNPEAATDDPTPLLPRSADLATIIDRFYPLVASMDNADAASGAFKKSLPVLTTTTVGVGSRTYLPVEAYNAKLGNQNGLDFCWALRVAEDPPPDAGSIRNHIHVLINGQPRQVAYALALPGALDMSGDNNLFDGTQTTALSFDPPQQGQNYENDDRTRAVSLGALWNRLECGEAIASIGHAHPNAATAAVMLYRGLYDMEQVLEQALALAEAQRDIAVAGVLNAVGAIIDAAAAVSHTVADVALEGLGTSVAAAVVMVAAAATVIAPAIMSLVQAVEVVGMAEQRYEYSQVLRASAKNFAEQLLGDVETADGKGLYIGK